MNNTMKLSNYLFGWFMKGWGKTIFITTGVLMSMWLLGTTAMPSGGNPYEIQLHMFYSYDMLVDNSGVMGVFFLGLFAIFLGIFLQANRFYVNGKGMYTIFTLPMKRWEVFTAFLLSAMASVLLYFAFWLVLMVFWYFPVTAMQTKAAAAVTIKLAPDNILTGIDSTRNNGLFLAFQRSIFLSGCFPVSYLQVATLTGGIFLVSVSTVFAGLYRESGVGRFGLLLTAGVGWYGAFRLVYRMILQALGNGEMIQQLPKSFFWGIGTLIFGAILFWLGIVRITRQKNI